MRASPSGSSPAIAASATAPPPSAARNARARSGRASHVPGPATRSRNARAAPALPSRSRASRVSRADDGEVGLDGGVGKRGVGRLVGNDGRHPVREACRGFEGDEAAEAVAHDDGALDALRVEERAEVRHVLRDVDLARRIEAARPAPQPIGSDEAQVARCAEGAGQRRQLAARGEGGVQEDDERGERSRGAPAASACRCRSSGARRGEGTTRAPWPGPAAPGTRRAARRRPGPGRPAGERSRPPARRPRWGRRGRRRRHRRWPGGTRAAASTSAG